MKMGSPSLPRLTRIKELVEANYGFGPLYRHFRRGGHVGALHSHRDHSYFARADLKNFFYSIRRGRVDRALRDVGIRSHTFFAKWSSVKCPYTGTGYVLPYGFIQSPILASLVMARSSLDQLLRAAPKGLAVSVFLDDISMSSDDLDTLQGFYEKVLEEVPRAGFVLHENKCAPPSDDMTLFNCSVRPGASQVLPERVAEFYAEVHSARGEEAFERYCEAVASGNAVTSGAA